MIHNGVDMFKLWFWPVVVYVDSLGASFACMFYYWEETLKQAEIVILGDLFWRY